MLYVQNSLFGSKSLIWKSDREQFTHVALYKRWTVSESLSLLIKKEQCEWFACDSSKSLAKNERFTQKICLFRMFETSVPLFNAQEWITHVALCSFALVSTWVICSRRSLQKSNLSNSLRLLITKERLWAIRWKKFEKIVFFVCFYSLPPFLCQRANRSRSFLLSRSFLTATVRELLRSLLTKERPWVIRSRRFLQKSDPDEIDSLFFSSQLLFHSQKGANRSKNRWANSQPWF